MEDKNGRSALSQGTVGTPTKVKATLASIPVATKSLVQRAISSMTLCLPSFMSAVYFVNKVIGPARNIKYVSVLAVVHVCSVLC